ncbi:DUF397 domain-containing protein [Streptomyces yanii]|uniref:DUF397 domain-containing protein n=1 Tax=Streptomyces yanii TaxID=78510 RepID=A0ABV5R3A1_9ACTN
MRTSLTSDLAALQWRKSSHSDSEGGECLEAADGFAAVAHPCAAAHTITVRASPILRASV